jgi:hypothetical protein
MDGFDSSCCANVTYVDGSLLEQNSAIGYNRASVDNVLLQRMVTDMLGEKMIKENNVHFPSHLQDVSATVNEMLKKECSHMMECNGKLDVFVKPAHYNISVFDSLVASILLGVLEKHGCSLCLVCELAASIPLMNGAERCHSTFQEIE